MLEALTNILRDLTFWEIIVLPLGYIMRLCYLLFNDVLSFPIPYVFAMFLFAVITRAMQLPLTIKQQKSMAKTQALNPLMEEIRKKYAKDQKRQQAEIQKLQEDMGVTMFSSCLPMLITFPIIFLVVEVIYKPLTYMLLLPKAFITQLAGLGGIDMAGRMYQNDIIKLVQGDVGLFSSLQGQYGQELATIQNFDMNIGGLNLLDTPSIREPSWMWIFPVFMIATMLLSQWFTTKMTGQANAAGGGTGKIMMFTMAAMFGVMSFTYPAGFSLYWGLSNFIMIGQSALMKKMVDSEKIKSQVLEDYYAKKKVKKQAKTVRLKDGKTGEVVEKTMSASEIARLRLQKARELDETRYEKESEDVTDVTDITLAAPEKSGGKGKKKKK